MNADFFAALEQLEKDKGIPQSYMIEKITATITSAIKKEYGATAKVRIDLAPEKKKMRVFLQKTVVEEVVDPVCEISLEEAKNKSKRNKLGQVLETEIKTDQLRRSSAASGKAVFVQAVREGERQASSEAYSNRKEEIITATVSKINLEKPEPGSILIEMEQGCHVVPASELIPGETFVVGQKIKVFLAEVNKEMRGPVISLSRIAPKMVWRLFELEIPEIQEGVVVIKGVSREAGSRTKIAVYSRDPDVDPVGACIGAHNRRLDNILAELSGEKIDIIHYSEVPEEYIAAALSPATVSSVSMIDPALLATKERPANPKDRACRVVVPADQLSLAIGVKGQNVRLAAKLTGYKIDIKPDGED